MSFTHKVTRSWSSSGSATVNYAHEVTAGLEVNLSEAIDDGETDYDLAATIDYDNLKSFFMGSDQDVTVETNNPGGASGAATQTFTLLANQPLVWCTGDADSCPVTADITALYITNGSGSTANFELRALVDPSP